MYKPSQVSDHKSSSKRNTYGVPDDAKACGVVTGTSDRAVRVG